MMKKTLSTISFIFVSSGAFSAEWIEANLNQIEIAGAGVLEGLYFAKDSPYQTSFSCSLNRYISIRGDQKLADRALSLALYAKTTPAKLKIYVVGCDAQGYLEGKQVMLSSQP